MGQEWLTVTEIKTELRVHAMTVYRLIHAGRLDAVKVGRSYRVRRADLDRYLEGEKS